MDSRLRGNDGFVDVSASNRMQSSQIASLLRRQSQVQPRRNELRQEGQEKQGQRRIQEI